MSSDFHYVIYGIATLLFYVALPWLINMASNDQEILSGAIFDIGPVALASMQFSRRMETEADDYAIQKMIEQGYSTEHFANLLMKITEYDETVENTGEKAFEFISSHPVTEDRIKRIRQSQGSGGSE